MALIEFLEEAAAKPFQFGVCDCCLFAADWVLRIRGIDVLADIRGAYSTEDEARRLIEAHGGLFAAVARKCELIGMMRVQAPQRGDVGIIDGTGGKTLAVAVSSDKWAVKAPEGIGVAPARALAIWRP